VCGEGGIVVPRPSASASLKGRRKKPDALRSTCITNTQREREREREREIGRKKKRETRLFLIYNAQRVKLSLIPAELNGS
jgi:hypothetical protein